MNTVPLQVFQPHFLGSSASLLQGVPFGATRLPTLTKGQEIPDAQKFHFSLAILIYYLLMARTILHPQQKLNFEDLDELTNKLMATRRHITLQQSFSTKQLYQDFLTNDSFPHDDARRLRDELAFAVFDKSNKVYGTAIANWMISIPPELHMHGLISLTIQSLVNHSIRAHAIQLLVDRGVIDEQDATGITLTSRYSTSNPFTKFDVKYDPARNDRAPNTGPAIDRQGVKQTNNSTRGLSRPWFLGG